MNTEYRDLNEIIGEEDVYVELGYRVDSNDVDVEKEFIGEYDEKAPFDNLIDAREFAKREAYRGIFELGLDTCAVTIQLCVYEGDYRGEQSYYNIEEVKYNKFDDLAEVKEVK